MSLPDPETMCALYSTYAHAWDEDRSTVLFERAWLEKFNAHLPPKGHILDIGCGSGKPIARYFLENGFAVTGIDGAVGMIGKALENFPAEQFPNANWRVCDMRALSMGRTYDGLIAWDSYFHLPPEHQRAMFEVFAKHSHQGSVLMFTSGPDHGAAIGHLRDQTLYHASLSNDEYRELFAAHGFEVLTHKNEDPDCMGRTVWLARKC